MVRAKTLDANRYFLVAFAAAIAACSASSSEDVQGVAQASAQACSSSTTWAEWKSYATGAVATFNGGSYLCLQSHTSQPGWDPAAAPALWAAVTCSGGESGGGGTTTAGGGGGTATAGGGGGTCNASNWVFMGNDPNACNWHIGESCGWTNDNESQGYHCATTSWGTGCSPGGTTCPGGTKPPPSGGGTTTGGGGGAGGGTGTAAGFIFSAYKDTSINMNWNTNVITTKVSGAAIPIAQDVTSNGSKALTLAFATGECGSESWGGVPGAAMGAANASFLNAAGVKYILSTGGAAGSFTCGSDAGMDAFLSRWASPNLVGVDFDIEAGQSPAVISALMDRIKSAHTKYPGLRFSLTLATLATSEAGQTTARALGSAAQDSLGAVGTVTMNIVKSAFGFNGSEGTWPRYLTVNLMTMDYGGGSASICVVSGSTCQMGQSAVQAAYNLHDKWGVPYSGIEITPMIGGNDVQSNVFTLADADTVARFAISQGIAGVHHWSYDRDTDCPPGSASPTCNSLGGAGNAGFLKRFLAAGLR